MGKWLFAVCVLVISLAAPAAQATRFYDVGTTLDLPPTVGAAWGDYDNDGYPDLYLGGLWENHRAYLLHNNGDGTFTDVTEAMGIHVDPSDWEDWGCAWGDFNNDGRLDLIVSGGNHLPFLYRNDGDHFTDIGGAAAGFSDQWYTGRGVAWGDYDGDNWLDLYVSNSGGPAYLYKNNRDGTFTEVTGVAGMAGAPGAYSENCAWVDYDGDGLLDLVVTRTHDFLDNLQRPVLYRNNGDGTFTECDLPAGLPASSIEGLAVGDYDNDGYFDLYFGGNQNGPSLLCHNNGDDTFTDVYHTALGDQAGNATGVAWGDYDNDGFLDLAQGSNTEPDSDYAWPVLPFLFHNDHAGTFTEVSQAEGVIASRHFKAACWADFNRDGRLDLLMAGDDADTCLFQNTGRSTDGHWLRVRALTSATGDATGGVPVRDAIGARVEVNLDNDPSFPPGRTLLRLIDGGSGFMSQSEQIAQFGLGTASKVAVRVLFPDHSIVTQASVAANQQVIIRDTAQLLGNIAGFVTCQPGGSPIIGAHLACGDFTARTDIHGAYSFPVLPAGSYTVSALAPGFLSKTVSHVMVVGHQVTTLNLALSLPKGMVGGLVTDAATGEPLAGAPVHLVAQLTRTDAHGRYFFTQPPAGAATVWASAFGYYWSPLQKVTVSPTQANALDFALATLPDLTPTFEEESFAVAGVDCVGAAWGDYDGDGYPDLLITGKSKAPASLQLYHNDRDLSFHSAGDALGLSSAAPNHEGVAWADFDNDGHLDFLANGEGVAPALCDFTGATFTTLTTSGLSSLQQGRGVAWGDYDGDNLLDVYLGAATEPGQLYHNNGDGTFTCVTEAAGMGGEAAAVGGVVAVWVDYDRDGRLDLSVNCIGDRLRLYHNNGNGTFTEVSAAVGLTDMNWPSSAFGVSWGDYDNDGWLDCYRAGKDPVLYHNDGGTFSQVALAAGMIGNGQDFNNGVAWADYNNDGFLDLYVGNWSWYFTSYLYRNNGDGTFANVTPSNFPAPVGSDAAVWGDADLDGRPDLFVAAEGYPGAPGCFLMHNLTPGGNWLRLHALTSATGDATNGGPVRDAIGARVELNVDDDSTFPPYRTLVRVIDGGSGFLSQNEQVAQFGVPVPGPVAVRVLFPDGSVVTHGHVLLNRDETVRDVPADRVSFFSDIPLDYWAIESINACFQAGIVAGYPDGTYAPSLQLDRAEMAVFIARACVGGDDYVPTPTASPSFPDVPTTHWAYKYIEYAHAAGTVQGYPDGYYHPDDPLNRAQMAVFIARAMCGGDDSKVPTYLGAPSFLDVPADFWALKHVEYLKSHNVALGYPDGLYHPEYICARDQMAVFVARAFDL